MPLPPLLPWDLGDGNLFLRPRYAEKSRWRTLNACAGRSFFGIWDAVVAPGPARCAVVLLGIGARFLRYASNIDTIVASAVQSTW